jgi:nitrite reductase/ring-hydroxylating ferredoxin subunit
MAPADFHEPHCVARAGDLKTAGCLSVTVKGHVLALFAQGDKIYAVDNRCPHMGFPLHRGTVKDGILTCHWHHARFDLASGGTFDPWADDVRSFPVQVRDGEVWVDLSPREDQLAHQRRRLRDGLERNIPLVIAKAVMNLLESGEDPAEPFRIGLDFGTRYRQEGWGQGLTIHTCMMNLLPHLEVADRSRAAYHGLSATARDCAAMPPRFGIHPLPPLPGPLLPGEGEGGIATLKRWFRQFVEVRDAEGAERCLVSAIRAGADHRQMADMLFTAATDHRYIQIGHVADFTNKAFEALDQAGWNFAEPVLASLASAYAGADRMEESNAWRHPVDLVAILERAFEDLPVALETGRNRRGNWEGRYSLVPILLGDDAVAIVEGLLFALREGASEQELAGTVAYAAALRIARFHTSNEFGDWDTALHTFTFANAVHQGLRRSPSPELLRGVFDAAMSVYLDRFLNVPAARLPEPDVKINDPDGLLEELPGLLDRQQQVNGAGELVAQYLFAPGPHQRLLAVLGRLLLREDRDFHTIQMVEAAFRQQEFLRGTRQGAHVLVAAARYLAAHAPTVRSEGQTYQIAHRLFRGERLFEELSSQTGIGGPKR